MHSTKQYNTMCPHPFNRMHDYFERKLKSFNYLFSFVAIVEIYWSIITIVYLQQNGQSSSESSDDLDRWLPVFVAITDRELRYDSLDFYYYIKFRENVNHFDVPISRLHECHFNQFRPKCADWWQRIFFWQYFTYHNQSNYVNIRYIVHPLLACDSGKPFGWEFGLKMQNVYNERTNQNLWLCPCAHSRQDIISQAHITSPYPHPSVNR